MILEHPIIREMILPFVLVFAVVFAILQRSKVLGEGKEQIDALVALVIGLLLIAFPQPRDIVILLMPWLAVGVVVILTFLILYGFAAGDLTKPEHFPKWLKNTFLGLAAVFTVGVLMYVSGLWDIMYDWFVGGRNDDVWMNILMIAAVVGAVALVVTSSRKSDDSST